LKFERTPQFDADLKRLSANEYKEFRSVAKEGFSLACDRRSANPSELWPTRLRVKSVQGTERILEMTWAWPNGRATFEWVSVEGERRVRWRRIGGHEIFKKP